MGVGWEADYKGLRTKRYKSVHQKIIWRSLSKRLFPRRSWNCRRSELPEKKNNNPCFFFLPLPLPLPLFAPLLFLFNQDVSNALPQETRRARGKGLSFTRGQRTYFAEGTTREIRSPKLRKDPRKIRRATRNQFQGSPFHREHAFRSSGLGHRKLDLCSCPSLSGIRRGENSIRKRDFPRYAANLWSFFVIKSLSRRIFEKLEQQVERLQLLSHLTSESRHRSPIYIAMKRMNNNSLIVNFSFITFR